MLGNVSCNDCRSAANARSSRATTTSGIRRAGSARNCCTTVGCSSGTVTRDHPSSDIAAGCRPMPTHATYPADGGSPLHVGACRISDTSWAIRGTVIDAIESSLDS